MRAASALPPIRAALPAAARALGAALALAACARAAAAGSDRPPWLDPGQPAEARIDDLLGRLTPEEKIRLIHGVSKFSAGGVERLGVPRLWTDDGPQGVREEVGPDTWEPAGRTDDYATAFPPGLALAATWDPDVVAACGRAIGEEARARGKHVLLGPGCNLMRTPLCGRNYDYYGEDPWLASRMAVAYVRGLQGEQVAACVKHFAANNQEVQRGTVDVELDERALRELYLPAFEAAVREGGALAVMGAYNRFRGQYCCENDFLLNRVLKGEWGFTGAVISDWGGAHDTRGAALNGLDLEMGTRQPYDEYFLGRPYLEALRRGELPAASLDDKVRRVLRLLYATGAIDGRRPGASNTPEHRAVARQAAEEAIVLLKNDGGLLPLDPAKHRTIAVIGDNAVLTFAAGGYSAGVKAFREVTALQGITDRAAPAADIRFSRGYAQTVLLRERARDAAGIGRGTLVTAAPAELAALADRAVAAAQRAEVVIFVGGLAHVPGGDDEGADRRDLALPAGQDALIARIAAANPRTIVVLIAGSPVAMPWLGRVPALLQAWYGGSEAGRALAAVLFGDVPPSGRLPCTFPARLADSPAHAAGLARQYPGENGTVHYDEGLLVGYRWFDARRIEPLFPFGFGLGYTTFALADLRLAGGPGGNAVVECAVTNTGPRAGAEVVQVYVHAVRSAVFRPERELKGFARVSLEPGGTRRVAIPLGPRAFSTYSVERRGWVCEPGDYVISVGRSSRDRPLEATIAVSDKP